MKCLYKRVLPISVGVALAIVSGSSSAAFFQLAENNTSGIGNAYAGGAAIAEDASVVWYNPAGLTRLSGSQAAVVGHFIRPSTEFNKTSANLSPTLGGGAISGGNGGDAGESAIVPNLYYTNQLDDRLFFGLGINAPFGLATEYDADWVGRYHALRSEIQTVNINPSLGYKVNEQWSVGAGVSYQKLDAVLTQAVDYGSVCSVVPGVQGCEAPGALDGFARIEAEDDAWGFNLGALWQMNDSLRVGAAYRSKMKYDLKGGFDVTAPNGTAAATGAALGIVDSNVAANVSLPATFSLSLYQRLTSQWGWMADVTRTFWSKLPELRIDFDSTQADSVVTLGLKDVNRYSVGVNYSPNSNWTYRAGLALDKTPTPSADLRTPRLPDEDRLWIALGANYRVSDKFKLDFGFVHIVVDDAEVNKAAGTGASSENFLRGSLVGTYNADVNILSVQGNLSF
jgi:long-chain fatty acid transport protein